MDAFEAIEINGLAPCVEDAEQAFCGIYIAGGIMPADDTACCPECIQILQNATGIDFNDDGAPKTNPTEIP